MGKIDEVIDGAAKLFTIGENPNDTVILFLRKWCVRMKYVFLLELAASLTLGFPAYGFYKIKNGNVDEFVDVAIKAAGVFHSEQETERPDETAEFAPCPHCGSRDVEATGQDGGYREFFCNNCNSVFGDDGKAKMTM